MSLEEILSLYRARLRDRTLVIQEALAVFGIAAGVALLFASQVASVSLNGSVRAIESQIVGSTQFQIDARGEGFSSTVLHRVERLPGVALALPLLDEQATITGPHGASASVDLIGADSRFLRAGGQLLKHFSNRQLEHQSAVALPGPLAAAIGARALEPITVQVGAVASTTLLGDVLGSRDIGELVNSEVVLTPLAYAQTLAHTPGQLTRIFVRARHGQEQRAALALRHLAAANHLNFALANFDAKLFAVASAPAQQGENLFAAISAFVGFLFAFNAMLLTVPARRQLIGSMRRRGATRTMTVQILAFDALVLGVLSCVLGLVLGNLLSVRLFHAQPGYLAFAFPVGAERIVTLPTVAISIVAGMAAAVVGVFAPLRVILARPLRSSAAIEHVPRGWTPLRLGVGVACLAVTTVILLARPQAAVIGSVALVIALLCLLPFLYQGIIGAIQRLSDAITIRLALAELRDPAIRVRSLAIAATGAIAVFGAVAISGAQHNLQTGLNRTAREWNRAADLWVSPAGTSNTLATTPFPLARIRHQLGALSGVRATYIYRGGFLTLGDRRLWVIAPPRSSAAMIPSGQLTSGDAVIVNARLRTGGWAVVSEAIARELHLQVGEAFLLPTPVPIRLRVAGFSTNAGWPPGAIVMNAEDYARAWGSSAASALYVNLRRGIPPSQGRREVQRALGSKSGLLVQTAGEREGRWQTASRQGLQRLSQIRLLVLAAAILAMAGVMSSMIWQRRRHLAYVRRPGIRRGTLWLVLIAESSILLGSGCSIGAAFGLYGGLLISHALATVTGFPIAISASVLIALASVAVVGLTSLAIVAAAGYLAVRGRATVTP